jgi:cytoskeleton protein RodZ
MNAIGEQFKAAREARGLSLDQVADETNIAKRFISAMEAEDFSVFPGDPYIIGFLRNYSDYLSLDSQAIVQSFRGLRIQEQPVPIDALLKPKKLSPLPFIAGAGVLALSLVLFLIFNAVNAEESAAGESLSRPDPIRYELDAAVLEKRFYEGDSVMVRYRGEQYLLSIKEIADRVAIESPVSVTRFMLGEEGSIDLDKDNRPELFIFTADFQKGQPDKGALIRISAAESLELAAADQAPESAEPGADAMAATAAGTPALLSAERPSTQQIAVFTGKRSPHPFVLNVTFRNYAIFRHEIDRKERVEAYYHKGDQITVNANNAAKIWASNAAAVKLTIQASGGQSVDLELGAPGEVVVKNLRWSQGDDGNWMLALYDVN